MRLFVVRLTVACGLALTLVGATVVRAASRAEEEHACRGDALRLCMADVPDKAKITRCMKQHYDQLSPACQAMFDSPRPYGRPQNGAPASSGR